MTVERRVILTLSEIKALVFECNRCKSRIVMVPEKLEEIPKSCPNGHLWQSTSGLGHTGTIFSAFINSIKWLREHDYQENGFKILLEFDEPTSAKAT